MTGYSCSTPIRARIPAAIALSTGLTEEACTRTSTSFSAGVGSGRSSRTAGGVSGPLTVTARIRWTPFPRCAEAAADCQLAGRYDDHTTATPAGILDGHRYLTVVTGELTGPR